MIKEVSLNPIFTIIISSILGAFSGGVVSYIVSTKLINKQSICEQRKVAFDLFNEICNGIKKRDNTSFNDIIVNKFKKTDVIIDGLCIKLNRRKSLKLRKAYEKYKAPCINHNTGKPIKKPFYADVIVPEADKGYNKKELALQNVEKILDLLK